MKINIARSVDVVLGSIICMILLLLKPFFCKKKSKHPKIPDRPSKILIIKFFGMGTITQIVPLHRRLKKKYPDSRIYFLSFSENKQLLDIIPNIDKVYTIKFNSGLFAFMVSTLDAILKLRKSEVELIFNCEYFSYYAAIITFLIRKKDFLSFGFYNNKWVKNWMFDFLIAIDSTEHIAMQNLKMLAPLGLRFYKEDIKPIDFKIDRELEKKFENRINILMPNKKKRKIIVNVNAGPLCYNRRWSLMNYVELINKIENANGSKYKIVLVGGKEDCEYVSILINKIKAGNILNLTGKLTIPELILLYKQAYLFIGNDSGPLHLAWATGIPTISFFGPETPKLYGPVGNKHYVFYTNTYCSPCLNIFYSKKNHCKDNICMKSISPEIVYLKVKDFLG
jgi:ADP-heptose:LPS heptosyltransferase